MTAKHTKHFRQVWEMQKYSARVQPTEDCTKTKCDMSRPSRPCATLPRVLPRQVRAHSALDNQLQYQLMIIRITLSVCEVWMRIGSSEVINHSELFPFGREIVQFVVFQSNLFFLDNLIFFTTMMTPWLCDEDGVCSIWVVHGGTAVDPPLRRQ